jgi:hypothetical protein
VGDEAPGELCLIENNILNDFLLNNQPDALIIQIYSVIKLYVSGILSAHHQEFSTVHLALAGFMQLSDERSQAESGRNGNSILTLLGSVLRTFSPLKVRRLRPGLNPRTWY